MQLLRHNRFFKKSQNLLLRIGRVTKVTRLFRERERGGNNGIFCLLFVEVLLLMK